MDEPSPKDNIILPEKYYLTYFLDLIAFIRKHSSHLLGPEDELFLASFEELSENAQCLFVRFSNRKGPYFRPDKLNYPEIKITEALDELLFTGFISEILDPEEDILPMYTKQELLDTYTELALPKNIKKTDLYLALIEHGAFDPIIERYPLVCVDRQEPVEYLKMLFFGHYHAQMTEFVVRDVGHVKLEDLSNHNFKPWFENLDEAKAVFDISRIYSESKKMLHLYPASLLHDTLQDIDFPLFSSFHSSRKILDKLIIKLGQQLEREKEPELALFYYQKGHEHPCRERQIRILDQLKASDQAEEIAFQILESPRNATERLFARDYLDRPKVKILRTTSQKLKTSKHIIKVIPDGIKKVETLALEYFEKQGYAGLHGENYLWNNLFGLTFWEELLDSTFSSYHHPLQRTSSDIHQEDFFEKRKDQLVQRLDQFNTRKKWLQRMNQIIESKAGISSPFVYWHPEINHHMTTLIAQVPLGSIKSVMLEMAKNLKENSKGFPDLFIWKENEYHFFEVKSPNDHLSAQQLFWLDFMASQKIKVDVLKLEFPE